MRQNCVYWKKNLLPLRSIFYTLFWQKISQCHCVPCFLFFFQTIVSNRSRLRSFTFCFACSLSTTSPLMLWYSNLPSIPTLTINTLNLRKDTKLSKHFLSITKERYIQASSWIHYISVLISRFFALKSYFLVFFKNFIYFFNFFCLRFYG